MKKIIIYMLILSLTVACSRENPPSAADRVSHFGLLRGTEQGYELDKAVSRAEAAALVVRAAHYDVRDGIPDDMPFSDVSPEHWARHIIAVAYHAELVQGVGGNLFAPEEDVDGTELAAMLMRAVMPDHAAYITTDNVMEYIAAHTGTQKVEELMLKPGFAHSDVVDLLYAVYNPVYINKKKQIADCVAPDGGSIHIGDIFSITVQSGQGMGQAWKYSIMGAPSLVYVYDEYTPMFIPEDGGEHTFYFKAVEAGTSEIYLRYDEMGTTEHLRRFRIVSE